MSTGKKQILPRNTTERQIEKEDIEECKIISSHGEDRDEVTELITKDIIRGSSPNMDLSEDEIELHAAYMSGNIQHTHKTMRTTTSYTVKRGTSSGQNGWLSKNMANNCGAGGCASSDSDTSVEARHLLNNKKDLNKSEIGSLESGQHSSKRKGRRRIPLSSDSESDTELPDINIRHKRMRHDTKTAANQKFNLRNIVKEAKRRESKRLSTSASLVNDQSIPSEYDADEQGLYEYP